jgi:NAD(P)H-dependent FMN reductase
MGQHILVISGTNRPGSNAMKVARVLVDHYKAADTPAEVLSLTELGPEVFAGSAYASKPPSMLALQQRVLDAMGLHVVTPEYNGSFPGVLKHFIDLLKFPESFERRPVAFTGEANGASGAQRSVEQLQMVFGHRNAHIYPQRVFIGAVKTRFDAEGRMTDPEIDGRLARQAAGFAAFARLLRQHEAPSGG